MEYKKTFEARWADIDMNGHMRHTAYNDYAAQARVGIFDVFELGMNELAKYGVGPVLFREETKFLKEIRLGQIFNVDTRIKAMNKNFRKWSIVHQVTIDADVAAIITVDGAWLGLKSRKIETPPEQMVKCITDFPKTEDFNWLD